MINYRVIVELCYTHKICYGGVEEMINNKNALLEIKKRFDDECKNINNYIRLMEDVTQLPNWKTIQYYIDTLKDYNLIERGSFEKEEYEKLLYNNPKELAHSFNKIYYDIEYEIYFFVNVLNSIDNKYILEEDELDELDQSILNYVKIRYEDTEELIEDLDKFEEFFFNEAESMLSMQRQFNKEYVEKYKKIDSKRLKSLMNTLAFSTFQYHASILTDILKFIGKFDLLEKINDSENILNVYRQGFILLISGFDATVFDMIKVLLDNKFFEYIGKFSKKEDIIRFQDIGKYENFEKLKDVVIGNSLKGKYIKELLEILKSLGVSYINDNYPQLIECMNRRNIHLHNQGIVDEKYLEKGNLFNFNEFQIASIDKLYFHEIFMLCLSTINSIFEWINEKI